VSGEQSDDSLSIELLADVRTIFDRLGDRVLSKTLASELASDPERPWAEWNHGKPISQKQLANLLRPFRIISETIRLGEQRAKGYLRVHFEDAFSRYLPQDPPSDACQRDNTGETGTNEHFRSVPDTTASRNEKREKINNDGHRHDVTDKKGGARRNGASNGGLIPFCAHCGRPDNAKDGRMSHCSDGGSELWLHRGCEAAWLAE